MKVYPTLDHLDREGRYLGLRTALRLVGRSLFSESWSDAYTELLALGDRCTIDPEAVDRVRGAELYLEQLILSGAVVSYGEDDEGALSEVTSAQLTKPYFRFSAHRGFAAHPDPDGWVTMYVDGPQLLRCLRERAGRRPRKTIHAWPAIVGEAWRFALQDQKLPRTRAAIVAHLITWCSQSYDKEPAEKDLRSVAEAVVKCLGDRRLERENSVEECPPDGAPQTA